MDFKDLIGKAQEQLFNNEDTKNQLTNALSSGGIQEYISKFSELAKGNGFDISADNITSHFGNAEGIIGSLKDKLPADFDLNSITNNLGDLGNITDKLGDLGGLGDKLKGLF